MNTQRKPSSQLHTIAADPSSFSLNDQNYTNTHLNRTGLAFGEMTPVLPSTLNNAGPKMIVQPSFDSKHDTRIVNEAFQDAVQLLEDGFDSKMQAEMLVLVDVLHKPASIFPANSTFRVNAQDKHFIGKLVRHFSFVLFCS